MLRFKTVGLGLPDEPKSTPTGRPYLPLSSRLKPCHLPRWGRHCALRRTVRPEAEPYRMCHTSDRAPCRARPPGRAKALPDREGAFASSVTAKAVPPSPKGKALCLRRTVRPEAEPYRMCHTSDRAPCRARPPGRAKAHPDRERPYLPLSPRLKPCQGL